MERWDQKAERREQIRTDETSTAVGDAGADAIWRQSATAIAARIRSSELSAESVTEAHLARIAAKDPKIGAIGILTGEQALESARRIDRMVASGEDPGTLAGVPVVIKNNSDVKGYATTHGLAALRGNIAAESNPLVEALVAEGAVVIGLSNMPEFWRWHTDGSAFGATVNPNEPDRTPGGSSGGSAAAVACGMVPLAHGNDGGGSLRYPAQCCGIASIKPSRGRVPFFNATSTAEGSFTLQLKAADGPMARSVADLRLGLAAMARPDPRDPFAMDGNALPLVSGKATVAMVVDPSGDGVDLDVARAIVKAARLLELAGYTIEEVAPPALDKVCDAYCATILNDLKLVQMEKFDQFLSPDNRRAFELLFACVQDEGADTVLRGLAEVVRLARAWSIFMGRFPLILGPVSTRPPFTVGEDLVSVETTRAFLRSLTLTLAANLFDLPAAVVPVSRKDMRPEVVQIVGRRYCEAQCLEAAEAIEAATEFRYLV